MIKRKLFFITIGALLSISLSSGSALAERPDGMAEAERLGSELANNLAEQRALLDDIKSVANSACIEGVRADRLGTVNTQRECRQLLLRLRHLQQEAHRIRLEAARTCPACTSVLASERDTSGRPESPALPTTSTLPLAGAARGR